jgi:hypothetical protein
VTVEPLHAGFARLAESEPEERPATLGASSRSDT